MPSDMKFPPRRTFALWLLFVQTLLCYGCCRSFDARIKEEDDASRQWLSKWDGQYDWTEITSWRNVLDLRMAAAAKLLKLVTKFSQSFGNWRIFENI